jgi:hypothetical protein
MQFASKQRYVRTKMVLPVRLCLERTNDCSQETTFAHTVDISPVGAQLGGFHVSLEPGKVITLQRHHNKGKFRVIWTKEVGPAEQRAGVEWVAIEKAVGNEINFWGLELPTSGSSSASSSFGTWLQQFK